MKIALSVRVTCDPKRVLESRWVHDTAHIIADNLRRARKTEAVRKGRKH
jgi:hypothetical protein